MTGYFFVLEGVDGAGKSTILPLVKRILTRSGFKVLLTAEPTPRISDLVKIRDFPYDPYAMFLLFTFDRKLHQEDIKNWVEKDYVVISDRYIASSFAYQGAGIAKIAGGRKKAFDWMETVSRVITVKPDMTFYLEIDLKTALERLNSTRDKDQMEKAVDLTEVAAFYSAYLENAATKIDASRSPEEVAETVSSKIRDFMSMH